MVCYRKMRQAIEVYSFLVRLLNYEDDVIASAEAALRRDSGLSLDDLHNNFYQCFQEGFCREADPKKKTKALRPTVNVHVFSHLTEFRKRSGRPLYETSLEPFECLYGVLRKCYRPGTLNTPEQAFEKIYMKEKYV